MSTGGLEALIAEHTAALAAWDAIPDAEWGSQAGKESDRRLDAAQGAMFAHRPATLEEVSLKASYMAARRTFTEWENFDQVELIKALTPAGAK